MIHIGAHAQGFGGDQIAATAWSNLYAKKTGLDSGLWILSQLFLMDSCDPYIYPLFDVQWQTQNSWRCRRRALSRIRETTSTQARAAVIKTQW